MIKAIVYTSNAGHTEEYAKMLGQQTKLPVYKLETAMKELQEKTEIIYMGWLMAGMVNGHAKAAKRFEIRAVCCTGMTMSDMQLADIRKKLKLSEDFPLFYLQGGFEMEKLHGVYRIMMATMKNSVVKKLEKKVDRSAEDEEWLELITKGGNRVSAGRLAGVISWYEGYIE